ASFAVFSLNVVTVAFSFLFSIFSLAGSVYLLFAAVAGSVFLFQNLILLRLTSEVQGYKVFMASMPYLTILMLGLMLDKLF
ncbi:MAG TPA: hypothetical protein VFF14_06500, partial [Candidatus Deferrimicrobium sp.]|nr:hypothetical protein [Candidatus Deferrimicrobium sp.]